MRPMEFVIQMLITVIIGSMLVRSVSGQQAEISKARDRMAINDVPQAVVILEDAATRYPKSHEVHYWLGIALKKAGKTDDAIDASIKSIRLKPKYLPARALLVDLYVSKERFAEALEESNFLIQQKTKDVSVVLKYAEVLIGLRQYEKASIELAVLKEKYPQNVQVMGLLGDVYARQNIRALAIPLYEDALKINPSSIEIKLKLAKLYFKEQSYDDALKEYVDVLRLDSNNAEANLNVGFIYYNAGKTNVQQYGYAIYYLLKYVVLKPSDYQGFLYLGYCYHALRRYRDAMPVLEQAVALDSAAHTPAVLEKLGECYMAMGRYVKVISTYEGLLSKGQVVDGRSFLRLASAYRLEKDTANAVRYFAIAAETDTTLSFALHDAGMIYYSAKRYSDAITWFERRIATSPPDSNVAITWLNLGLCHYYAATSRQDTTLALACVRKAIVLKPYSSNYHTVLAQIAERADSVSMAEAAFRAAISLDSTNAQAYVGLGGLALKSGKYDEAIFNLNHALAKDDQNKYAHYAIARAYARRKKNGEAVMHYKKYLELDPDGPYSKDARKELVRLQ